MQIPSNTRIKVIFYNIYLIKSIIALSYSLGYEKYSARFNGFPIWPVFTIFFLKVSSFGSSFNPQICFSWVKYIYNNENIIILIKQFIGNTILTVLKLLNDFIHLYFHNVQLSKV